MLARGKMIWSAYTAQSFYHVVLLKDRMKIPRCWDITRKTDSVVYSTLSRGTARNGEGWRLRWKTRLHEEELCQPTTPVWRKRRRRLCDELRDDKHREKNIEIYWSVVLVDRLCARNLESCLLKQVVSIIRIETICGPPQLLSFHNSFPVIRTANA